jgi:hypothetical protein
MGKIWIWLYSLKIASTYLLQNKVRAHFGIRLLVPIETSLLLFHATNAKNSQRAQGEGYLFRVQGSQI